MPRYLVERTFPDGSGWLAAADHDGADLVAGPAQAGVSWLHSYVTPDRRRSWCICDGPSPEAIRVAARNDGLPVDRITEVDWLDPYPRR